MLIYCDSTTAITKTENCDYNGKRRLLRHEHIKDQRASYSQTEQLKYMMYVLIKNSQSFDKRNYQKESPKTHPIGWDYCPNVTSDGNPT